MFSPILGQTTIRFTVDKDNYFPGKVLEKINTHSYSGCVHYAQN